jgi:uncharacterized membrane protein YpjA
MDSSNCYYRLAEIKFRNFLKKKIRKEGGSRRPNIAKLAEKNLLDFTIFSYNTFSANISPTSINDVIFRIDSPKSSLFNFYLIAFCGVLNSPHFDD